MEGVSWEVVYYVEENILLFDYSDLKETSTCFELDMTQSYTCACDNHLLDKVDLALVTRKVGEYFPPRTRQQVIVIHPSLNGRGGRRRCTSPVENTSPLPSGSPAVHRPHPCDVLATQPSEDPCLRAFENQTRVIGWPGYGQDVKLGETNLGGAGGEVAGVPALGAGCSSAQCQCQSCLCAEGEESHGPPATGGVSKVAI